MKKNIIDSNSINVYKSIFEDLPYGVFYFDKNGIIQGCNNIFLKSVNSTRELMIGFDAINKLQNKEVVNAMKNCISTGSGYYEGPYISVTGNKSIVAKGIFKAIYNNKKEFEIGLCSLEDITIQHKQKQELIDLNNEYATLNKAFLEQNEELHRINDEVNKKNKSLEEEQIKNIDLLTELTITEKNYRTIFFNSPLPMIVHSKGVIVLINEAAKRFANIKDDSLVLGKSVLSFVHHSSKEKAGENIARAMSGEQTKPEEETFLTIDGKAKDVVVNSSQFTYNNENALLVAFADISEVKESKLKLEKLNLELTEQNKKLLIETQKNKEILVKLANAEKNYRTIIENSPIPILVHLDGKFIYVNDETVKFIQLKNKEDIIGKSIIDFIHPDSQEFAKENIKKVLEGDKPKLVEEKFLTIKGETRNVLLNTGQFIYDNKTAIVAAFVDVTEIKKSEEQIKIISKGIDTSPASIVITDVSGDIQFVNPKFVEVTGYTKEEAFGENPRVLKSGYHNAKFYDEMWGAISNGDSWRGEIQNKRKNGDLYWEYAIISPIHNDKGHITHYIAIKEDVTRRKEIEKKLLKNEKHFKTLYNTAPDGIFEIDNEGVIINCNIEFANSVRVNKSKLIGTKASGYIENKKLFARLFTQLKAKGFIESEVVQENGDGTKTIVWRKVTSVYDKDGNFTGAIAYNREITEIKEAERQLTEAKDKAEESDRLKSAFLSNMSHEIRTPLNAIIGFSELISRQNIQGIERSKYSEYIKHNSKVLLNLINDIIDVSKIEANQIKVVEAAVHMNNMFTELHQIFTEENKKSNKNVDMKLIITDENIIIKSDEYRIRQIITNLVVNAIKFTEKGTITYGYYIKDDNLYLFVKDTGQGINSEFSSKIFDRFIKINKNNNNASGTGLGLSIVKSLTELLGGQIEVKSEENVGTEFIIKMPCCKMKLSEVNEKEDKFDTSSLDWSDKTILVAEDDEFNFIVLEESLKPSKVKIIHANNGLEAVKLFKQFKNEIDLVLMDIQMPGMNGYDATKELIKIDSNVKVIAQTAFAMADERNHSIEVGCIDYITKPIDIDTLNLLLANYLQ